MWHDRGKWCICPFNGFHNRTIKIVRSVLFARVPKANTESNNCDTNEFGLMEKENMFHAHAHLLSVTFQTLPSKEIHVVIIIDRATALFFVTK